MQTNCQVTHIPHIASIAPRRRPVRRWLAGAWLAACLATPIALADDMPTLNLVIRDGRFVPAVIEAPANTKFRLLIKNEGPGAEEFESTELRKEKVLAPGASSFLIFMPLKPGSYPFFGDFHPQTAQGRIVVK